MAASAWTPVDETAAKWTPVEENPPAPVQDAGFLHALGSDLIGMAKGLLPPTNKQQLLDRLKVALAMASPSTAGAELYNLNRNVGQDSDHGALYRAAAPAAAAVGVNVPGMEQSAAQGDVGGVLGHAAAVPTAMAISEAAPKVIGSAPVAKSVRVAVQNANKALAKAPGTIGGTAGGAIGAYFGGHVGAEIGGAAGYALGREVLPTVKLPGEGFGLPNRVIGGPEVAPAYEPPAAAPPAPKAAPKITKAAISDAVDKAVGVEKLKPNVPIKEQLAKKPSADIPEGHSPVESSAMNSYKYDADAREFEVTTPGGQHYVYGDVSPTQAKAFEMAESKGKAWNTLRNNSTLVAKVIKGKRVAIKPITTDTEDLTQVLQDSLDQAKKRK